MVQQNFCHRLKLLTMKILFSITCIVLCTASLFVDTQPLNGLIFKNETLSWVHRFFPNQCFLKKMALRWAIALRFLCQDFNSRSFGLLTYPWFLYFSLFLSPSVPLSLSFWEVLIVLMLSIKASKAFWSDNWSDQQLNSNWWLWLNSQQIYVEWN